MNYRWTGTKVSFRLKPKRVIVGDYLSWFCWYMEWRRFGAFPILLLVKPMTWMLKEEERGFLDGLLTRIAQKERVHSIVILEDEKLRPVVDHWFSSGPAPVGPDLASSFQLRHFREAVAACIYGRSLARNRLLEAASHTLSWKLNPDSRDLLRLQKGFQIESRKGFWSLTEDAEALVQGLEWRDRPQVEGLPERVLQPNNRKRHARPDEGWLVSVMEILLDSKGSFTIPELYWFTDARIQGAKDTMAPPRFLDPDVGMDYKVPDTTFAPSEPILRRLVDGMVRDGKLHRMTWHKEIGRPTILYYGDQVPPIKPGARCGQCAFYVSLRRQCRLWWLLGRSFGLADPRWKSDGEHPLPPFELYKMRNSSRISPHSSACTNLVDKKRDYSLKELPPQCDICGEPLSSAPGKLTECVNCRTRYFRAKKKVRVLTAYEHRFQSTYLRLAGRKPSVDLTRLREERTGSGFGAMEEIDFTEHRAETSDDAQPVTLMLFPGDKMLLRDHRLSLLGRQRVETVPVAGSVIVDHGVLEDEQIAELTKAGATIRSVAKSMQSDLLAEVRHDLGSLVRDRASDPEIGRIFAVAMAESAIHATEKIGKTVPYYESVALPFVVGESMLLRRLERAPSSAFLTYEALIMKQYWKLYDMALKVQSQRFGPRKKSRFVREQVASPTGRARGYTAVDSAVNYLHQRRVFKIREANTRLGIAAKGEGFLHRKRWNAEGLGLILDLADPLKFADRQKLLEAFLNYTVNWRDFHMGTDRQGVLFYYPKSEAIAILEKLSDEADNMIVVYNNASLKLSEAYERGVLSLSAFLEGSASTFEPFMFRESTPQPD